MIIETLQRSNSKEKNITLGTYWSLGRGWK